MTTESIQNLWERAKPSVTEWYPLAEAVFDALEDSGYLHTQGDIEWLSNMATSSGEESLRTSSIRLIGMLAERETPQCPSTLTVLRALLSHSDPSCRYYAVRAVWQAGDRGALPNLSDLLETENASAVKRMLKRAIYVLTVAP